MTGKPPLSARPSIRSGEDQSRESAFWVWFRENLPLLEGFNDQRDLVVERMREQLDLVHHGLTFELGQSSDGTFEFIVSADGVRERFPQVIRLVKAAPGIEGWRVLAFRPRSGTEQELNFAGVRMTSERLWYRLEEEDGAPGLVLFIDGLDEEEEDVVMGAVFIMLDMALGEYDVETKLGFIEPHPLPLNPEQLGLRPFHELPDDIDRFFGDTLH